MAISVKISLYVYTLCIVMCKGKVSGQKVVINYKMQKKGTNPLAITSTTPVFLLVSSKNILKKNTCLHFVAGQKVISGHLHNNNFLSDTYYRYIMCKATDITTIFPPR